MADLPAQVQSLYFSKNKEPAQSSTSMSPTNHLRKKGKAVNKIPEFPSKISNNVSSSSARSSFIRLDTAQILKNQDPLELRASETAQLHIQRYIPQHEVNKSASPPSHLLKDPALERKIQEIKNKQRNLRLTLNKCQGDKAKELTPSFEEDKELFQIIKDLELKVKLENQRSVPLGIEPNSSSSALQMRQPPTTTQSNFDQSKMSALKKQSKLSQSLRAHSLMQLSPEEKDIIQANKRQAQQSPRQFNMQAVMPKMRKGDINSHWSGQFSDPQLLSSDRTQLRSKITSGPNSKLASPFLVLSQTMDPKNTPLQTLHQEMFMKTIRQERQIGSLTQSLNLPSGKPPSSSAEAALADPLGIIRSHRSSSSCEIILSDRQDSERKASYVKHSLKVQPKKAAPDLEEEYQSSPKSLSKQADLLSKINEESKRNSDREDIQSSFQNEAPVDDTSAAKGGLAKKVKRQSTIAISKFDSQDSVSKPKRLISTHQLMPLSDQKSGDYRRASTMHLNSFGFKTGPQDLTLLAKFKKPKPKFSYIEPVVYEPCEWMKQNKIQATRLRHGIDPLRNNGLKPGTKESNMFFSQKTSSVKMTTPSENPDFQSLIEGTDVLIFLEEEQVKNLATSYRTVTEKYLVLKTRSKHPLRKRINLKEIEGFIFGGFASRFWVLKNYINLQSIDKRSHLPENMLAWNMLSIQLKSQKYLDLVVPHFRQMDILIQLLATIAHANRMKLKMKAELKACDSILDRPDREAATERVYRKYKNVDLSPKDSAKLLTFYKIARIRMKISYFAWRKGTTVKNLLLNQIFQTHFRLYPNNLAFDLEKLLSEFSLIEVLQIISRYNTTRVLNQVPTLFRRSSTQGFSKILVKAKQNPTFLKQASSLNVQKKFYRRSYQQNLVRLTRLQILCTLFTFFKDTGRNKILVLQLMMEREAIIKDIFCQQMKFQSFDYFRVPPELTQEVLPLAFHYYNMVIPTLESLRKDCFKYYIEECQKCTKYVIDMRKQRELKAEKEQEPKAEKNVSCSEGFLLKMKSLFGSLKKKKEEDLAHADLFQDHLDDDELKKVKELLQQKKKQLKKDILRRRNTLNSRDANLLASKITEEVGKSPNTSEINQKKEGEEEPSTSARHYEVPHFASNTLKFTHKNYGRPKAMSLAEYEEIPEDKIEFLMENEVHRQREDFMNEKMILYFKFMNIQLKKRVVCSSLQRTFVDVTQKYSVLDAFKEEEQRERNLTIQRSASISAFGSALKLRTPSIHSRKEDASRKEEFIDQEADKAEDLDEFREVELADVERAQQYLLNRAKMLEKKHMLSQKEKEVKAFLNSFKRQNKYEKKMKMLQYNLQQAISHLETEKNLIMEVRKLLKITTKLEEPEPAQYEDNIQVQMESVDEVHRAESSSGSSRSVSVSLSEEEKKEQSASEGLMSYRNAHQNKVVGHLRQAKSTFKI